MTQPLWTPSEKRVRDANLTAFIEYVNREKGLGLAGYDQLYEWSVAEVADFWEMMWKFAGIRHTEPYSSVLDDPKMPGARWFEGAKLNFAENMLARRSDAEALATKHLLKRESYILLIVYNEYLRSHVPSPSLVCLRLL